MIHANFIKNNKKIKYFLSPLLIASISWTKKKLTSQKLDEFHYFGYF